ncbi:hypothetical protein [Sphingobium sp. KCTC 72723]|uniref:hypothetical protein n=1 Tax=Sphingobium sp. KCTC 72723 TaxID=2733867 RepID=UPI00165D5D0F|nr:hypothetical protein [Sphingobium sp. KCTC 72723]
MTTISNYNMTTPPSPRASMDRRIDAAVEAGSLTQVDGDALDVALDSIDTALASSASESSARLDPSAMKDRIDTLIDSQVSAGTLTEEQASALRSFFAQGGPQGASATAIESGSDGMSVDAMGGPGPMRGPPPSSETSEDEDSSSASTSDASSATEQLDSIIAFLENLRSSLSQSLYGSAASSTDSSNSGLLVDTLA